MGNKNQKEASQQQQQQQQSTKKVVALSAGEEFALKEKCIHNNEPYSKPLSFFVHKTL